jgi:hypothetical protein
MPLKLQGVFLSSSAALELGIDRNKRNRAGLNDWIYEAKHPDQKNASGGEAQTQGLAEE